MKIRLLHLSSSQVGSYWDQCFLKPRCLSKYLNMSQKLIFRNLVMETHSRVIQIFFLLLLLMKMALICSSSNYLLMSRSLTSKNTSSSAALSLIQKPYQILVWQISIITSILRIRSRRIKMLGPICWESWW